MWSFINKRNFDKGKNCGFTLSKAWRMTPVPAWVLAGGSAVWKILQYSIKPEELNEAELRDIVTFAYTSAGLSTTKKRWYFQCPGIWGWSCEIGSAMEDSPSL